MAAYSRGFLALDNVGFALIGADFRANGLEPPTLAVETHSLAMMKIVQAGQFLGHLPHPMFADAAKFDLVPVQHEGTFWESSAGIVTRAPPLPQEHG